jgi:hypothetical protein
MLDFIKYSRTTDPSLVEDQTINKDFDNDWQNGVLHQH